MRLGKVVKSNSHCDYVVQVYGEKEIDSPPQPNDFGFGSFVKLEDPNGRHWAVGVIYNSLLDNPQFSSNGPRLSSEADRLFAPDLVVETRTLLGVVLIGSLDVEAGKIAGFHGIPRVVVPINTPASTMSRDEIYQFHLDRDGSPKFGYYSHLLKCGGGFSMQLTQQVLMELAESQLFSGSEQRALEILCRELSWKTMVGAMR
jgi:hypothetical protein